MDKIFFGLKPFLGYPALFAIVGFACDQIFDDDFKAETARRIRERRSPGTIQEMLLAFNSGLVDRFFGAKFFSPRFFVRSFLMSFAFLGLIIAAQALVYRSDFRQIISVQTKSGIEFAALLVIFGLLVDVICNVSTITILRMAAARGKLLDLVISFVANMTLTMTIFTWIFPIGLAGCLIFSAISADSFQAKLQSVPPSLLPIISASSVSMHNAEHAKFYKSTPFIFSAQDIDQYDTFNTEVVFIIDPLSGSKDDEINSIALMMSKNGSEILSMRGDASMTIDLPYEDFVNPRFLLSLYTGSFSATETVRSDFFDVIRLSPIAIRMGSIYALARASFANLGLQGQGLVLCQDYKVFEADAVGRDLDALIEAGEQACGSHVRASLLFGKSGRISDEVAGVKAAGSLLPLAAFFLSSFTISLFYYFGLTLTASGLWVNLAVTKIFRLQAFNVKKLPFTFLGMVLFFVSELFWIPISYFLS